MGISEFILSCVYDRIRVSGLNDSQEQFLSLFDTAYKRSCEPYFKREMIMLNKLSFNTMLLIKTQNIFMKQLSIPQEMDKVINSFVEQPIMTIAREEVKKELMNAKVDNINVDE